MQLLVVVFARGSAVVEVVPIAIVARRRLGVLFCLRDKVPKYEFGHKADCQGCYSSKTICIVDASSA